MLLKSLDEKIRRAFSNSALRYEVLANLQNEIGRELAGKIDGRDEWRNILDVGMGTGRLTNRLKLFYPGARVTGIDSAGGMVDAARRKYDFIDCLQADARYLPFREGIFDCVVSNLAYQWVDDLGGALGSVFRSLKPDGEFHATIFGYETFRELFDTFFRLSGTVLHRLPSRDQVNYALGTAGFTTVGLRAEMIKTHFADLFDLVKWIKGIGANAAAPQSFIGKEKLNQANRLYQERYRDEWGVYATFEVIWVKAKK